MASYRHDLALAAYRTGLLAERFPGERDSLIAAWAEALGGIEAASAVGEAEALLTTYRERVEDRLRR